MKYRKAFIFLLISLVVSTTNAQLSGIYTIGGINPDFATISQAADSLIDVGSSDTVVFNIRPGIYNEQINLVQYANSIHFPITFQSENLDSSSVIINNVDSIGYTFKLSWLDPYIFRSLTITSNSATAIKADSPCEIYNCRISALYDAISNSRKLTSRNTFYDGNLYVNGSLFEDNIVDGKFDCGYNTIFQRNIINGVTYIDYGYVKDNLLNGHFGLGGDSVYATNNTIYGNVSMGGTNGIFLKNEVHGTFNAGTDLSTISYNLIFGELRTSHSDSCSFIGNKVIGEMRFVFTDYAKIYNNFIIGNTSFSYSDHCYYAFNNSSINLSDEFKLSFSHYNLFEFNIMPPLYSSWLSYYNVFNSNNFPLSIGNVDLDPFHLDPQYVSNSDLHATNPQLIGKAIYNPAIEFDIDSIKRPVNPTLGANEICFNGDTLNAYCGDSIVLSVCNLPIAGNFHWSPSNGLNNTQIPNPKLHVTSSEWYYVADSLSNFTDSIFINLLPFNVNTGINDSIAQCGNSVFIQATYNMNATYQWSPIDSLSNPFSASTIANPSQTSIYTVSANVPGCGVTNDSIEIFVNPLPTAYTYLDSVNCNYFAFLNASLCADSFVWNFGDSVLSTDVNPVHIYADTGQFTVTITACNNFGCSTFAGLVFVDCISINTGISNISINEEFSVYPNPAKEFITVFFNSSNISSKQLIISDALGKNVYTNNKFNESEIELNISHFSPGLYFIELKTGNSIYRQKFICR